MYQDKLDWNILQQNPRIHWDLELIHLFLQKCRGVEISGSKAMYNAIRPLINENILSDVRKLYAN